MRFIILFLFLLASGVPVHLYAGASLIDPTGQIVDHTINVHGAPNVKALAHSPDGKELWAALLMNNKRGVVVFHAETGAKIIDIDLHGGGGTELIFSKDGTKAYVSQMETARVFEIDVVTKKILRTLSSGSTWTKVIALSSDEKTLYASNWVGSDVSVIDLTSGALLKRIKTVKTPRGLYPTNDGQWLYVAGFDTGELQKINLATGEKKVIFDGGALRHIVADTNGKTLFISDMLRRVIWKVDLETDTVTWFATTDANPNTIALSPDGKILFVSCRGRNHPTLGYYYPGLEWGSVLLFDATNGKMLDAIIGGNQPTALSVSLDGTRLVFSDFLDGRIEFFNLPSHETFLLGKSGRSTVYKKELTKTLN